MSLNHEQKQAIDTTEGPILVLAGAGSGKTRVVTFRIAHLIEKGVAPSKILGLTFTNKAATEMKERVQHLTRQHVLICTFHSLGAKILRESIQLLGYHRSFHIYDDDDVEKTLKSCMEDLPKLDFKVVRQAISKSKNQMVDADADRFPADGSIGSLFPQIYRAYQHKLKESNALDYDDLLFLPVKLFREFPEVLEHYQNRWSHLLIDEYQDTNALQYSLVNSLAALHHNLCVVGDPDQSIYSWRGADINNILSFEMDYSNAQVIRLNQNYRSTGHILNAANAVIANNGNRYHKNLWSDLGAGEKVKILRCDDEQGEARFVAQKISEYHNQQGISFKEMAVFYRTNAQSREFEDLLLQYRIPYVIVGGVSFYQRKEIKDLLAWLRVIQTGTDQLAFERTLNLPKRGIGETTLEKMRLAASQEGRTLISYCRKLIEEEDVAHGVKLTTKQKQGLKEYFKLIDEFQALNQQEALAPLIVAVIDRSRYREHLESDPESMQERIENLNSLIAKAAEWSSEPAEKVLSAFLEELSLKSTLDESSEGSLERISLMTIHNGKGLEFDLVFLAGMEEDLFPHVNSRLSKEALEEERRLCYVGMTRAKKYLYLTYVTSRFMWGVRRAQRASRFLSEIPKEFQENLRVQISTPRFSQPREEKPQPPPKVAIHTFEKGDMVYHNQFGIGQIREVASGSSGLVYRVFFQKDNIEKSLVAEFAQLTPL